MKLEVMGRIEPGKVFLAFPPDDRWRARFAQKGFVPVMSVTNSGGTVYTTEKAYEHAINSIAPEKLSDLCLAVGMGEPVVVELSDYVINNVEVGDPNEGDEP